jgi:hypothetical protein
MNMDVWTLGEKYKDQKKAIESLEARVKYLEVYLSQLTKDNKKENAKVQDKKSSTSGVRTRRRVTKKS